MNYDAMERAWNLWMREKTGQKAKIPMVGPIAEVWMAAWTAAMKTNRRPLDKQTLKRITDQRILELARDIERAHGIGEDQ